MDASTVDLMTREGLSTDAIAARFGVSLRTINRARKRHKELTGAGA